MDEPIDPILECLKEQNGIVVWDGKEYTRSDLILEYLRLKDDYQRVVDLCHRAADTIDCQRVVALCHRAADTIDCQCDLCCSIIGDLKKAGESNG